MNIPESIGKSFEHYSHLIITKSVPVFVRIIENSRFESLNAERVWHISMFLAANSLYILPLMAGSFLLFELFGGGWAGHRRTIVGTMVWVVNFSILLGLASFFTLAMIAFPNLR